MAKSRNSNYLDILTRYVTMVQYLPDKLENEFHRDNSKENDNDPIASNKLFARILIP